MLPGTVRNFYGAREFQIEIDTGENLMKGIVLWLMGVPLIVIILLYMFVF